MGFREIYWTWESKDSDIRVGHMGLDGRTTLADLLDRIYEVAPDVPPEHIQINGGHVKWARVATEEELADRRTRNATADARQEEWERTTLTRLIEKYGPEGGS